MQHDSIAVLDFGGQYAHLIATKIRRAGVLAEIRQPEDPIEALLDYRGIIISGSPSLSSHGQDSAYDKRIYDLDVPILGLCFGHQEIAKHYGGRVTHGGREWGPADLHLTGDHVLFRGLAAVERVWMSHYDSVVDAGPQLSELGYTLSGGGSERHRFAAIGSDSLRRYGLQFHPEVDDTPHGDEMISNFVRQICGCRATWSMEGFLDEQIERIRAQVGDDSVFLLASGGVDSTVAATVLSKALGPDRVKLLHIDNGLMRQGESAQVVEMFQRIGLGGSLHSVDAGDTFLQALRDLIEPEVKRHAIGAAFIDVFNGQAAELGLEQNLLGQGTIYPDTVETGGTKRADTIKTHHNRVPVIEEMLEAGRVVEPLAQLYKVEVRELGERLGIPREVLSRHPFPGPGLGVRVLCSGGAEEAQDLSEAHAKATELASTYGLEAMALPIRSVGVKADLRAYERPVLLSGVATWDAIAVVVSAITAEVPGVNRCIWNLAPRHPKYTRTIAATVTRGRLNTLRKADHIVMQILRSHGLYHEIWQCPTVLVPLGFDDSDGELVVVRPVRSQRAMTATPVDLPGAVLRELRDRVLPLRGVGGLALDVTPKPPGTIEWE